MTVFIVLALGWVLVAILLGVVMGRRGYNGFGWGITGGALGPIAVLIALTRHVPDRITTEQLDAGHAGTGPIDVLVAVDGSLASIAAGRRAVDLFARRLGTVTIATVVPFDATVDEERAGEHALDDTAEALRDRLLLHSIEPRKVVLRGAATDALRAEAVDGLSDVIVVGSQGRGATELVLGSVAADLLRSAPVPVLVGERVQDPESGRLDLRAHAARAS